MALTRHPRATTTGRCMKLLLCRAKHIYDNRLRTRGSWRRRKCNRRLGSDRQSCITSNCFPGNNALNSTLSPVLLYCTYAVEGFYIERASERCRRHRSGHFNTLLCFYISDSSCFVHNANGFFGFPTKQSLAGAPPLSRDDDHDPGVPVLFAARARKKVHILLAAATCSKLGGRLGHPSFL
ncbi:hypothetical protein K440DRAFT_406008 [Wilcoxina mikolae CBS 423.85]|nr:hypothetical protein K440DRAFT_406008 [Wilcoxina mikolae CBS 423.85]